MMRRLVNPVRDRARVLEVAVPVDGADVVVAPA
jgi:hypothetical protein